ncbi:MAG: hypothetical protein NVSMB63_13800 [Sediminibacterium sp.]
MNRTLFVILAVVFVMVACMKDTVTAHYTFYRPVYKTKDAVRADIKSDAAVPIQRPGKLVIRDHFVFLNDIDKGVHVIDIADPSKPNNIAFINIPGCVDLAINGNHLYADCYTDLVTLDISDPLQVTIKSFLNGVFPHRYYYGFQADTSKVIQEWVRVDTVIKRRFNERLSDTDISKMLASCGVQSFYSSSAAISPIDAGIAGSLARFALLNNRMYTVSNSDLKVFNVTVPALPSFVSSLALVQGNIETIFPYRNNLFIGSQTGMFIYNASNPDQPQKTGQFAHVRTCDPVIADGNYAYTTLRGGSKCGGFTNELDIINITNLSSPSLEKVYPLTAPEGLSKDGNLLFICDGKAGVKILDITNTFSIILVKVLDGFEPHDIIAINGIAIAVAKDGLYCIDYSDATYAKLVSKIPVVQNK